MRQGTGHLDVRVSLRDGGSFQAWGHKFLWMRIYMKHYGYVSYISVIYQLDQEMGNEIGLYHLYDGYQLDHDWPRKKSHTKVI